jgi:hypothetical protein
MIRCATLAVVLVLSPALAVADDAAPAPKGNDSPPTDGMAPAEDPNVPERPESEDQPDDPDAETTNLDKGTTVEKKQRPTKATYPLELTWRPLTLTAGQAEISLDSPVAPFADAPTGATQVLRFAYGITQDIQIGVTYGAGAERLKKRDAPSDDKGFEPGLAMSIDGAYTILPDHLAVTLSLPIYFQPFTVSATIGAPFRLRLGKKLALYGGHDLVRIAMNGWPIDVASAEYNLGQVANDTPGGETLDRGQLNLNFGAQIQLKPAFALVAETGFHFIDFGDADRPMSAFVGGLWSAKNAKLDLGGRLGFGRLDEKDSLFLALFVAYRI